jgi:UDP-N-acetylglucosamine:LPS N-acetylglucosamine transferase
MKQDNYPVTVYCINPKYDIEGDYRLKSLREQGVAVESIYDVFDHKLNAVHGAMRFLFMWFFAKANRLNAHNQKKPSLIIRTGKLTLNFIGVILYYLTKIAYYNKKWASDFIKQSGVKVLCFDHVIPNQHVVAALLRSAKKMSIPTLALPHGVYLYTNEFTKATSSAKQKFYKFNRFDYVIVQTQLRKDVLAKSGISKEKICVLGSARFCKEWIAQNNKILPRMIESNGAGAGKLKVVFMPSKPRCRVDIERMHNTINILASLREIEAVVKPHTRTGREAYLFNNMPLPNVSRVHTPELCEWADVVLIIGSSVITEALMQNKPVLYLKYLHANTMLFEECGACWTIHNESELEQALRSLQVKKMEVPYLAENVNRYLSEVVYGGENTRDVLRDYVQFIASCKVSPKD